MNRRALLSAIMVVALVGVVAGYVRASEVPELLPRRTVAYLRLADIPTLCDGLKKQFAETFKGPPGERPDAVVVGEVERALRQTRAVHVCFTGVEVRRRGAPNIGLLAVAETERAVTVDEFLPPILMKMFRKAGDYAGVPVYALEPDPKHDGGPGPFYAASVRDRVFLSTDKALLRGALDAAANGRARSLANLPEFREMTQTARGAAVTLFVSVRDLLSIIGSSADSELRRGEAEMTVKLLGLRDMEYAAYTSGADGMCGTLSILMETGGEAYRIMAQPAAMSDTVSRLPQTTVLAFAQSIGDGKDTWSRLTSYVRDWVSGKEDARPEEFDEGLARLTKQLGVDPAAAAALIEEIGVFAEEKPTEGNWCLFMKVKDARKAAELMKQIAAAPAGGGEPPGNGAKKSYEHLGATIELARNFSWMLMDDCVFIAGKREILERVIAARQEPRVGADADGKALRNADGFSKVRLRLHDRCSLLGYCDVGRIVTPLEGFRDAPPSVRDMLKDLVIGCSMTVKDGIVEIRFAPNKKVDLAAVLSAAFVGVMTLHGPR